MPMVIIAIKSHRILHALPEDLSIRCQLLHRIYLCVESIQSQWHGRECVTGHSYGISIVIVISAQAMIHVSPRKPCCTTAGRSPFVIVSPKT